jgi:hypothetical protein
MPVDGAAGGVVVNGVIAPVGLVSVTSTGPVGTSFPPEIMAM